MQPESDRVLLQRFVRTGDEAALEMLVRRYHGLVFGVCSRVLRHRQWAEDAYQSTFQVLIEQAGSIRRQEVLASWLYGVAYRASRRVQRREVRRMNYDLVHDVAHDDDPLEKLCRDHESELLDDELSRLPDSLRQPLILRYQLNLSNLEVAQRLRLSVAAVEGRLKRARALLRYRLTRQGVTLSLALGILSLSQQVMAKHLAESTADNDGGAGGTHGERALWTTADLCDAGWGNSTPGRTRELSDPHQGPQSTPQNRLKAGPPRLSRGIVEAKSQDYCAKSVQRWYG